MGDASELGPEEVTPDHPSARSNASPWRTHATLAIGLVLCAAAFWFELRRALSGNALSWAYVFEWPLLGAFAVYMWWKVIHPDAVKETRRAQEPALAPEFADMLGAWREHQAELARSREDEVS